MTEIAVPLTVPDPATTRWVPVFGGGSGGGAALPADTVVAAATRIIANLTTAGDAQPAWRVLGSGRFDWGPGGATAPDTNLYRSAAAVLQTDGGFVAAGLAGANTAALQATSANGGYTGSLIEGIATFRGDVTGYNLLRLANTNGARFTVRGDGSLLFFSDTNLYRSAAGILKTDNSFITAGNLSVLLATGDTQPQIVLSRNFAGSGLPGIQFGVGGSTAGDTNLYRSAAGILKTDTRFDVGTDLTTGAGDMWARFGAATQVKIGNNGAGVAGILFGSAADAGLYRNAANQLRTPGSLVVDGLVTPASLGTGTPDATKYLRGDGSWQAVAGGTPGYSSPTVSGANTDLAYPGGASMNFINIGTGGGSIRSIGAGTAGARISMRNIGAAITLLHATAGGTGAQLFIVNSASKILPFNGTIEFEYDGTYWIEVHRPGKELIQTITLGASAFIDFQNIPACYTHLEIEGLVRSSINAGTDAFIFRFNNDSTANYECQFEDANNTVVAAGLVSSQQQAGHAGVTSAIIGSTGITNRFSPVKIEIPNYADTGKHKMYLAETYYVLHSWFGGSWQVLTAINRISLGGGGMASFVAGSTLSLYGITG